MALSSSYTEYILDQLAESGSIVSRRMFGGLGIYVDDVFCAIVGSSNRFYLRVGPRNINDFKNEQTVEKAHLLRCAQSSRSNVLPKYASARRFLARLAPGTFLTGLETGFFKTLLERHLERGCPEIRITAHLFPANSLESTHNS